MENKLLEPISKELSILRPVEKRLESLKDVFGPLFEWNKDTLNNIVDVIEKSQEFIIEAPGDECIPLLKSVEEKLAEIKSIQKKTADERLSFTRKFDVIKDRLSIPEKTLSLLVISLNETRIKIAKRKEVIEQKAKDRQNELISFRSKIQTHFNNNKATCKRYIQEKMQEYYSYAIKNVEITDLSDYLNSVIAINGEDVFQWSEPYMSAMELVDKDKVKIYNEIIANWIESAFVDEFKSEISTTFASFDFEKPSQDVAIAKQEEVIQSAKNDIEVEKEIEDAVIFLDEKSAPSAPTIFESTKSIVKVHCISMEHNEKNMIAVEKAFFVNRQKCFALYRGGDIWKIDTIAKANLLCKLKDANNELSFKGIEFSIVEK